MAHCKALLCCLEGAEGGRKGACAGMASGDRAGDRQRQQVEEVPQQAAQQAAVMYTTQACRGKIFTGAGTQDFVTVRAPQRRAVLRCADCTECGVTTAAD